jgi:hypothetical protein
MDGFGSPINAEGALAPQVLRALRDAIVRIELAPGVHPREILASLPRIAESHPEYFEPPARERLVSQRKADAP